MRKFRLTTLAILMGLFVVYSCIEDKKENIVVELPVEERLELAKKYDYAWNFSEGLAGVKLNGKFGFIDNTGKQVVPCVYDDVRYFSAFDIIVAIVGESEENQVRYYYDRDGNSL